MVKAMIFLLSFFSLFIVLYGYNNKTAYIRRMKSRRNKIKIANSKFPIAYGATKKGEKRTW
jgi:hypothetical protein